MNELALNIEYLLLSRNCVIVPGLGAFTTRTFASQWLDDEEVFLPPVRHIRFNADLFQDPDELFIRSISQIYELTEEEAQKRCADMVAEFHKSLVIEGTVDFGSIGLFTLEDDAEITMSPYECGVTSPDYYGLDTLHFPLLVNQPEEASETMDTLLDDTTPAGSNETDGHEATTDEHETAPRTIILPKGKTYVADSKHIIIRLNRAMVHYTMIAAACIILFFLLGPSISNDTPGNDVTEASANVLFSSNNKATQTPPQHAASVASKQEKAVETPVQATPAQEEKAAEQHQETLPAVVENVETEVKEQVQDLSDNPQIFNSLRGTHSIVLASAVSKTNAKAFVESLEARDVHAIIYDNGKMLRVVIDGFSSQADAYNMNNYLHNLDKSLRSTWVMKN